MTQTSSGNTFDPEGFEDSIYEDVMTSSRARHAYFNTTRGVLAGRFEDEDLQEIMSILNDERVAYFYNADDSRPEPMFLTSDSVFVGVEEIKTNIVGSRTDRTNSNDQSDSRTPLS